MTTFRRFDEIDAWQKARVLTRLIYELSGRSLFAKDFALREQIRRAAISLMANIAEGFERHGRGEFVQFLAIAKGSSAEVLSHAYLAFDQAFMTKNEFDEVVLKTGEVSRMIAALMAYLRKSGTRGLKFKLCNDDAWKRETRN